MDLTNKEISILSNSSDLGWRSPKDHPVKFGIIWLTGFRSIEPVEEKIFMSNAEVNGGRWTMTTDAK